MVHQLVRADAATVHRVLHIRQRTTATAAWAARGYPPLVRWTANRPEPVLLYWALTEFGSAATSADLDAINDLLDESELLIERIWTEPEFGGRRHLEVVAISTALWSEVQRGRGADNFTEVALHARLLRNLVAPPAGQIPARPTTAVPPYRPVRERIRGGRLPLAGQVPTRKRDLPEQFLLLLAVVLSNGRGHLVDHETAGCPRGCDPEKTGWGTSGLAAGVRLGSIRGHDRGQADLLLRPGPCLTAIKKWLRTRPVVDAATWTTDDIGWALADAWLTDTTLILEATRITRASTAPWAVTADGPMEKVWRLPLAVYHPHQFHPAGEGWRGSAVPLRPIPDR